MLIVDRQNRLVEILKERKTAQLETLAEALGVSSSTVRRDVEALEEQGVLERTHGGVIFRPHQSTATLAFEDRMRENIEAKRQIGAAAAKLVQPGMTVFIDGGSTMHYALPFIEARPLQVVTHSLTVAVHFSSDDRVELLVLGGQHYPRTGVMVGPITTQALAGLHMDLMLFSRGMYENDLFNSNLVMAEVEKLALRQAARKALLIDSSKFGRKSLAKICSAEELDLIITDAGINDRWKQMLGDRVQVA